jgi:galactosylceramidase
MRQLILPLLFLAVFLAVSAWSAPIVLDGSRTHSKPYDATGALSAGASSRLLIDYPQPERERILDLLFKPKFGASLNLLKVELGGDTQSTDGSEPSHAHSRAELDSPDCERGYELWLMREAKKRNPDVQTYGLSWGAPGWIGNNSYFSQDNVKYQTSWLTCVREKANISVDYMGIWNEKPWGSTEYITELRAAFDAAGFEKTKLIALDGGLNGDFVQTLDTTPALANALSGVGLHYPCSVVSPSATIDGMKYWASEDMSTPADWRGSGCWGRILNSNFVRMNMTATISWSLLWSVYPNLDCYGNGLMYAYTPWSGFYMVNVAIWTSAHTTQFAEPGWLYLSVPSGGSGSLARGGTYVTLREPVSSGDAHWSLVLETLLGDCMYNAGCLGQASSETQSLTFQIGEGLRRPSRLSVWQTNQTHQFVQLADALVDAQGQFTVSIAPDTHVTVTTTSGQRKGSTAALNPPADAPFPLPYSDDFSYANEGGLPRYLSDQGGAFEVHGGVLRQVVTGLPIAWSATPPPTTIAGDANWTSVLVSVDAVITDESYTTGEAFVGVCARLSSYPGFSAPAWPPAYCLVVFCHAANASFSLLVNGVAKATGPLAGGAAMTRRLTLSASGVDITASIDGQVVAALKSTLFPAGMIALLTGYHLAEFDNLSIGKAAEPPPPTANSFVARSNPTHWDFAARTCNPEPFSARLRNDFTGFVGMSIRIGGSSLVVSHLGRFLTDGGNRSHNLTVVSAATLDEVCTATLVVQGASPDSSGFAYASVSGGCTLKAGEEYFVASAEMAGRLFF